MRKGKTFRPGQKLARRKSGSSVVCTTAHSSPGWRRVGPSREVRLVGQNGADNVPNSAVGILSVGPFLKTAVIK